MMTRMCAFVNEMDKSGHEKKGRMFLFVIMVFMALVNGSAVWSQTTYPTQIGVEVSDRPTG
ncbi:hypothetical protein AB4043_16050, partial [Terriglobus sp. YAF25]|uniref:hypothetical protein n=1 Tax=Terriglobus sp. YAF25 TaxID=3233080 RepID=UPI003F9852AD